MKTINKLFNYIFHFCLGCILLTSCTDFLDNKLHNATYAGEFWKNQNDANSGISGGYGLFRTALHRDIAYVYWGDCPAGFLVDKEWNCEGISTTGNFRVSYKEDGLTNWLSWYRIIQQTNLIIDQVPQISDNQFQASNPAELRNQFTGEGYFLRALSYFYMTRIWGDLPLEITPIYGADDIVTKERSSDTIIMKQIISDAQMASTLLNWENDQLSRTRATKGAALALLAHAHAWKHDYSKVLLYVDSLINNSPAGLYELEDGTSLLNIFNHAVSSNENIFYIPKRKSDKEAQEGGGAYMGGGRTLKEPYLMRYTNLPLMRPNPTALNNYFPDKNDLRYTQFFGLLGTPDPILIKYSDVSYDNMANFTAPYCESNTVIFRLADMILLKAEALFFLGNESGAKAEVNIVRARAGIAPLDENYTSTILKKEIINERFRELVGEGHNFYDQIRMEMYPTWFSGDRAKPEMKGWLWPIYDDILKNNYLIDQNEWWKSH